MDLAQLKVEIEANPACAPHIHTNEMPRISSAEVAIKDQAIADIINVGRVRPQSKEIGIGTILAVMAPAGGVFLDGLNALGSTDRNVYWSMELIRQGRFDIGMPAARAQVQALADGQPDLAAGIEALLALGVAPDPVSAADVSRALRGPWE